MQMSQTQMIRSPALSDQLHTLLSQRIAGGEMPAGSRLPSEAQLVDEFGVSRTVVREAIARLRSDGLVTTRAGLGAFVADSLRTLPFRLTGRDQHLNVREVFELRLGLEAEAAALAAERGTPAQIAAIAAAKESMAVAMQAGADGVEEDFQFHRAIAEATNNSIYRSFLSFLEPHLREQMQTTRTYTLRAQRVGDVEREHAELVAAIRSRDPLRAREAARAHLRAGMERQDQLAAQ
jgi:DNA-binding FadR family transcriptional regulator